MSKIEVRMIGAADEPLAYDSRILVFSRDNDNKKSPVMFPRVQLRIELDMGIILVYENWGKELYDWLTSDVTELPSLGDFDEPSRYVQYFLHVVAMSAKPDAEIETKRESFHDLWASQVTGLEISNRHVRSILHGFSYRLDSATRATHVEAVNELTEAYSKPFLHMVVELLELFYSGKVWPAIRNGKPALRVLQGCDTRMVLFRSIVPDCSTHMHVKGCFAYMELYNEKTDGTVNDNYNDKFSVRLATNIVVVYKTSPTSTEEDTVSAAYVCARGKRFVPDHYLVWSPIIGVGSKGSLKGTWGRQVKLNGLGNDSVPPSVVSSPKETTRVSSSKSQGPLSVPHVHIATRGRPTGSESTPSESGKVAQNLGPAAVKSFSNASLPSAETILSRLREAGRKVCKLRAQERLLERIVSDHNRNFDGHKKRFDHFTQSQFQLFRSHVSEMENKSESEERNIYNAYKSRDKELEQEIEKEERWLQEAENARKNLRQVSDELQEVENELLQLELLLNDL